MKSDKKNVNKITPRSVDFARWYTDVVRNCRLMDYSSVKGSMIFEPYGYAIWENIKAYLDNEFKTLGHSNVYMPSFIPEHMIEKEKKHVEGFSPELLWITHAGDYELEEKMCIRPTSEVLFCEYYKKNVNSYRDLPQLLNQWCNVVRWEKTTRPFLRNTEFLWQEGHTVHMDEKDSLEETLSMLDVYAKFCKNVMLMAVITGKKTEKEKFAGAVSTYTVESLMHDGKALQCATSHYLGENFSRVFDIKYLDLNNKEKYAHQTSWGISTRIIGAMIMVHGDDFGLKIPPKIAPIQIVIIPILKKSESDEMIFKVCQTVEEELKIDFRIKMDLSNKSPGWKYNQYEMLGVPLRIEIGIREVENSKVAIVRRDTGEKKVVELKELKTVVFSLMNVIEQDMYNVSYKNLSEKTVFVSEYSQFAEKIKQGVIIESAWCGNLECELKIKTDTCATSRCIKETIAGDQQCIVCGETASSIVYWAIAY